MSKLTWNQILSLPCFDNFLYERKQIWTSGRVPDEIIVAKPWVREHEAHAKEHPEHTYPPVGERYEETDKHILDSVVSAENQPDRLWTFYMRTPEREENATGLMTVNGLSFFSHQLKVFRRLNASGMERYHIVRYPWAVSLHLALACYPPLPFLEDIDARKKSDQSL
jgi:hypothetical protein